MRRVSASGFAGSGCPREAAGSGSVPVAESVVESPRSISGKRIPQGFDVNEARTLTIAASILGLELTRRQARQPGSP